MVSILTVAALVSSGIAAGTFFVGLTAVHPALRPLAPGTYITVKQALDRTYPPLMKPLQLINLAFSLALAVAAGMQGELACAILAGLAALATVANLVVTICGDLPINVTMALWRADDPPPDWASHRARWDAFNRMRTVAAVAAFVLLAVASVAPR